MLKFQSRGEGDPILLIHGFPMNARTWDPVASLLQSKFNVITVDLPGFGKSDILDEGFSLEDVAAQIINDLRKLVGNRKTLIVGHSLGGYVALAMAAIRPELIAGLVLHHSTALPDSAEKKESRTKVIQFIEDNGVEAFTSNFVAPLFSTPNHERIDWVRQINLESLQGAVIGYTAAMRDRPDRAALLHTTPFPVLFIVGDSDPGIPLQSIISQTSGTTATIEILEGQAHMALVEVPDQVAVRIEAFVARCLG